MANLDSVEDILAFAISEEEGAYQFYTTLASRVSDAALSKTLLNFAEEELGHKRKLQRVRDGERVLFEKGKPVTDMKIADYLVEVEPSADMDYQAALILAMKKEKAAFRLYTDFAEQCTDEGLREMFLGLAQEEAKHKLRFEVEYDERILEEH